MCVTPTLCVCVCLSVTTTLMLCYSVCHYYPHVVLWISPLPPCCVTVFHHYPHVVLLCFTTTLMLCYCVSPLPPCCVTVFHHYPHVVLLCFTTTLMLCYCVSPLPPCCVTVFHHYPHVVLQVTDHTGHGGAVCSTDGPLQSCQYQVRMEEHLLSLPLGSIWQWWGYCRAGLPNYW